MAHLRDIYIFDSRKDFLKIFFLHTHIKLCEQSEMIQVKEKDSYGEYGINYEMCMSLGEAKKRYYEVFKEENEKMKKTYELNDGKNNHFDKFENALNGATLVFVKETIFESGL